MHQKSLEMRINQTDCRVGMKKEGQVNLVAYISRSRINLSLKWGQGLKREKIMAPKI